MIALQLKLAFACFNWCFTACFWFSTKMNLSILLYVLRTVWHENKFACINLICNVSWYNICSIFQAHFQISTFRISFLPQLHATHFFLRANLEETFCRSKVFNLVFIWMFYDVKYIFMTYRTLLDRQFAWRKIESK